ncbi:hypothetical protein GF367_01385 [Candidatus Woesearchaeota archaeon]|nr:hypothetical protein [Candidatus Woesearchaeota archaeon]
MVNTEADIKHLPPAERVKRLKELQMRRRQELERLRQEKEEELQRTKQQLDESMEELELEGERAYEEQSAASLEEAVGDEAPEETPEHVTYGSLLERLMPNNLYELSDYNLYNELRSIEEKGYMTSEEQRRVAELREQTDTITEGYSSQELSRVDQERGNYLARTEEVLKRLDQRMHDVQDGLYDLDRRDDRAVYQ